MITSPDPQTNYIFEALQNQRDNLLVENGSLTARVKELESQLAVDGVSSETITNTRDTGGRNPGQLTQPC